MGADAGRPGADRGAAGTSVIFGALIATIAFKEPFGRARIVVAVMVAAGILVLSIP